MKAKTTRCCSIQAAEAACSKVFSDAEAQKTPQAVMFQEEHRKYLQSLEDKPSGRKVEVAMRSSGCLISPSIGTSTSIPTPHSASKDSLCGRTAIYSCSPHANTQTVSKTEKAASFARADRDHAPGWSHPSSYIRGTSQPQEVREPSLVQVAEAQPC